MAKPVEELLNMKELPYDPSKWLSEESAKKGIKRTEKITPFAKKKKFREICRIVEEALKDEINTTKDDDSNQWLDRQHAAIVGEEGAIKYFISKIEEVLRARNITSVDYPTFFDSLSEAIFHEVWGMSVLVKWDKLYPDSEAAVIRGQQLWIDVNGKFVKQEEEFESQHKVDKIKENFKIRQENAVLNKTTPELEIEREDGSRITMVIPPRAKDDYIVIRRFIVKSFTLENQANLNTILHKDIPIFRALAKTLPNTMVCGRVRSAKSTFMKTMIAERDSSLVIACLEKHFELALKRHLPERLIFEFQVSEGDLHEAIPRLLRMEHDMLIVGECRSSEFEAAMMACERGERGFMTTYHLTDVFNIVPQVARHLLDEFPNRTPELEIERVAKNIDIIITMGTDRNRKTKRVLGVTEVMWDHEKRTHKVQDLIRYSKRTKRYYYSSAISPRLFHLLAEENETEAQQLLNNLKEREKESPLSDLKETIEELGDY
ncbi:pilus assembly protein CpaF [Evansella vedderi]|uniref:Pilus assembly protein CpaF n=1 Tax=Evansella vedderi TaxID=38282 RepID=A0ABT9ZYD8_9BACI|nr:ATPase, T2SS/T4P/T4SS family [Evansella vedderi]MDQ0255488.1 pilus assembly protein CpaF [Evansella vedderi]